MLFDYEITALDEISFIFDSKFFGDLQFLLATIFQDNFEKINSLLLTGKESTDKAVSFILKTITNNQLKFNLLFYDKNEFSTAGMLRDYFFSQEIKNKLPLCQLVKMAIKKVKIERNLIAIDKVSLALASFLSKDDLKVYHFIFTLLLFNMKRKMEKPLSGLDIAMLLKNLNGVENYSADLIRYSLEFAKKTGFASYFTPENTSFREAKASFDGRIEICKLIYNQNKQERKSDCVLGGNCFEKNFVRW